MAMPYWTLSRAVEKIRRPRPQRALHPIPK
jgi:hypothetical protein